MLKSYRWGGGPCDFRVSPSLFGLDFGTLDFGTSDLGLTIKVPSQMGREGQMLDCDVSDLEMGTFTYPLSKQNSR